MVSRNETKMNEKFEEMRKEVTAAGGPTFESRIVVADFSVLKTLQDYKKVIVDKVADLDIGVVVLNAGHAYNGSYDQISMEEIES